MWEFKACFMNLMSQWVVRQLISLVRVEVRGWVKG